MTFLHEQFISGWPNLYIWSLVAIFALRHMNSLSAAGQERSKNARSLHFKPE